MAIVIPDVWTMSARFTASGHEWHLSTDITSRAGLSDVPPPTDPIVTAWIAFCHDNTDSGVTQQDITLFKKRGGEGPLPIADTVPLWLEPVGTTGNRETAYGDASATTAMDLQVVAYARKICAGRSGKLFMRGLLREGDVTATAGSFWTLPGVTGTVGITSFHTNMNSHLSAHLSGGAADYVLAVCHIRTNETGDVLEHHTVFVSDIVLQYAGWFRRDRG